MLDTTTNGTIANLRRNLFRGGIAEETLAVSAQLPFVALAKSRARY